jgi:hypothetical protein
MNQTLNIKAEIASTVSRVLHLHVQMYRAYTEMIDEYEDSDELGYQQDLYDLRQARRRSLNNFNTMKCSYRRALDMMDPNQEELHI